MSLLGVDIGRDVQILTFHKIFESRYLKSIRTNVIAVLMLIVITYVLSVLHRRSNHGVL
jgi:hypothetical protein